MTDREGSPITTFSSINLIVDTFKINDLFMTIMDDKITIEFNDKKIEITDEQLLNYIYTTYLSKIYISETKVVRSFPKLANAIEAIQAKRQQAYTIGQGEIINDSNFYNELSIKFLSEIDTTTHTILGNNIEEVAQRFLLGLIATYAGGLERTYKQTKIRNETLRALKLDDDPVAQMYEGQASKLVNDPQKIKHQISEDV